MYDKNKSMLVLCPSSPICVSSKATEAKQRVEPFIVRDSFDRAWVTFKAIILTLPRTKLVDEKHGYLHVEIRSLIFRFVATWSWPLVQKAAMSMCVQHR